MKHIRTFNSFVLPASNERFISLNDSGLASIYTHQLNHLYTIPDGYLVYRMTPDYAIIAKNRHFKKLDLNRFEISFDYGIHAKSIQHVQNRFFFFDRKTGHHQLINLETDQIEYSVEIPIQSRIQAFYAYSPICIGMEMDSREIYTINLETGELIWRLPEEELNISSPGILTGHIYAVEDSFIATVTSGELIAIDAGRGHHLWNTTLARKSFGQLVLGNRYLSFRLITGPTEQHHSPILFTELDLRTGQIISQIDVTAQFLALGGLSRQDLQTLILGKFASDGTSIYFGINQNLIKLHIESGQLEHVYTHEYALSFYSMIAGKLFCVDGNSRLQVFTAED
ncbi:MAG: PQQ-binding-like beta-propeller repeat protein [Bacteroidota bacterium]